MSTTKEKISRACEACGDTFRSFRDLRQHLKDHLEANQQVEEHRASKAQPTRAYRKGGCMRLGVGFLVEHPLGAIVHAAPSTQVTHTCPVEGCGLSFSGGAKKVLHAYQDHAYYAHPDLLEDCGSCGAYHFPWFDGDCREDWERF